MTYFLRSILIVLALATPVAADDFRSAYERGMAHFHAKELAKARTEFLAAYAIQPDPTVLFAIAQTYRFEGNFKEAIDWYKKFLADSQAAQDLRAEAQDYLTESETRLRDLEEQRRKAAETGPRDQDGTPATMPTGAPIGNGRIDPPPPPPTRTRRIPLGSKIAAGVTGVGLVTAIVVTKLGLDAERDFEALGNAAMQGDADRVKGYQHAINLSWGITTAAAITSVVLYFATPRYNADQPRIVVAPNADGWSAAVTARF